MAEGGFLFRFALESDRAVVLERGVWFVGGRPFFLQPWERNLHSQKLGLTAIPLWVSFPGLPLHFWGSKALSKICSVLGKPLHTDRCTMNKERIQFARACVEFSSKEDFLNSVTIVDDTGIPFSQEIKYDWQPPRCSLCQIFGHSTVSCLPPPASVLAEPEIPVTTGGDPPSLPVFSSAGEVSEALVSSAIGDSLLPPGLPHIALPAGHRLSSEPVLQPSVPCAAAPFSFPRKRRVASRSSHPAPPSFSKQLTSHAVPPCPNRFEALIQPSLTPVIPLTPSSLATCPGDPLGPRQVDSQTPAIPCDPVRDCVAGSGDPDLLAPSEESNPVVCSHSVSPSLRGTPHPSVDQISGSPSVLPTPPPTLSGPSLRGPGPVGLSDRYKLAKSVASRLLVNPSSATQINPVTLVPADPLPVLALTPINPTQAQPPLLPFPSPAAHSGLVRPAQFLGLASGAATTSRPPDLSGVEEVDPISFTEGSDYEDHIDQLCEDSIYMGKMKLFESSSSDEERSLEKIHSNRTKFHCDESSSPKQFRKTPRRS